MLTEKSFETPETGKHETMSATVDSSLDSYLANSKNIEIIQTGLSEFWKSAHGWAPENTTALLDKSRLDWLPSLATSLRHWAFSDDLTPGDLILAWANLGSLLEGSIKLFLAVYLTDYENDAEMLVALGIKTKKGYAKSPDGLMLDQILKFCRKRNLLTENELTFAELVRDRRNLIHAFKDKPIGTTSDFRIAVATYLVFLADLATRLPYPVDFHWLDLAGRITAKENLSADCEKFDFSIV